jgi:hypothetical protein
VDRLPIWALYVAVFAPPVIAGAVAVWSVLVNRATAKLVRSSQTRDETGRNVRAALELACSTDEDQRAVGMDQLEALVTGGTLDNEQKSLVAATLARKLAPVTNAVAAVPKSASARAVRRSRQRVWQVRANG